MYNIKDVAEIVLGYGPMSHKKLQKLCYYAYAWYYVVFHEKLCDTYFEAWVHGPVSPELYAYYKRHGWSLIRQTSVSEDIAGNKLRFIESIVNIYGSYDADSLENKTHAEDPWVNARKGIPKYASSDNNILENDILEYYPRGQKEIYISLVDNFLKAN